MEENGVTFTDYFYMYVSNMDERNFQFEHVLGMLLNKVWIVWYKTDQMSGSFRRE
jgi:hypothetical protein